MAHFAQLDENNVVTQVIVIHNNELLDNGEESEAKGLAFCQVLFPGLHWKQTSYNGNFRKNYAGIGYTYLPFPIDGFAPPRPYPSWNLNPDTCHWVAPLPYPADGLVYAWDEAIGNWQMRP